MQRRYHVYEIVYLCYTNVDMRLFLQAKSIKATMGLSTRIQVVSMRKDGYTLSKIHAGVPIGWGPDHQQEVALPADLEVEAHKIDCQ